MLKRSGTRQLSTPGLALFALGLLLILPCGAFAEDLQEPHEIAASGGGIDTQLRVKSQNVTFESGWTDVDPDEDTTCYEKSSTTADLRMYGFPDSEGLPGCIPDDGFCYSFPGPTYRMRRGEGQTEGDTYKLALTNKLTPNLDMGCSAGGVSYTWDESPNCFHGAEVTNHHFHGFHVSPNPNPDDDYYDTDTYSDYIYVKIYPEGQNGVSPSFPETQVGTANYQLAPLSSSQHEGTHWYHPHKHGATAEQVGNGMAGAFIVEGPYDDWVETEVCAGSADEDCALEEQVLVVQEILSQFVFPPQSGDGAQFPVNSAQLVNGQLYPKVSIAPGEVQRWRVVNATMKAGSAFYFLFPPNFDVRQIGMDGVPFVEGNYNRQPLLGSWNSGNSSCVIPTSDGTLPTGTLCVLLHPGNRGDFLVKRPEETKRSMKRAARGRKAVGKRLEADAVPLFHERAFFSKSIKNRRPKEVTTRRKRTTSCAHPNLPGLFEVNECPGTGCDPKDMSFPSANYPPLNSLATISNFDNEREITYKIEGYAGAQFPAPFDGTPEDALLQQINSEVGTCQYLLPQFTIDGEKFDGNRIDQQMLVNTSEQWKFVNQAAVPVVPAGASDCPGLSGYVKTGADCSSVVLPPGQTQCLSGEITTADSPYKGQTVTTPFPAANPIQHPVHLHVNPFQVWSSDDGRKSGAPYVWQDVMGLNLTGGQATMRSTFEEITGEYVMHCHILGHEDRGMMQNLKVCTGCTSN